MARLVPPERNRAALSSRQLRRFHHVINSDKVFGTHSAERTTVATKPAAIPFSQLPEVIVISSFVFGVPRASPSRTTVVAIRRRPAAQDSAKDRPSRPIVAGWSLNCSTEVAGRLPRG